MLMMRLQRIGRRNEPHFKIVVIEKTKGPKSQKYVDIIGSYNPKLGNVQIDKDKAAKWLATGVQPSDTVRNFLIDQELLEGRKVNVLPKKSPTKKKNAPEEEAVEAEAETVPSTDSGTSNEEAVAETETEADTPAAEEAPAEEAPAEEAPAEEAPAEEVVETPSEDTLEEANEGAPENATEEKAE